MADTITKTVQEAKKWTYKDYLKLDDDARYEIIDGELIMAPSPITNHQTVSKKVQHILYKLEEKGIGTVFNAPLDVVFAENQVVQPDIIFILPENKKIIQEKGIFGSPDLVIEILSPSSAQRDRDKKYHLYERFGVKEYWIIDPLWHTVEIFVLENNIYQLHRFIEGEGVVQSRIIKEFELDVQEIIE